jgi:hypothetical protein
MRKNWWIIDRWLYRLGAWLIHSLHGVTAVEHQALLYHQRADYMRHLTANAQVIQAQRERIEALLINEALHCKPSVQKRREHFKQYVGRAVQEAMDEYFKDPELNEYD